MFEIVETNSPVSETGHSDFVETDDCQGRCQATMQCFSSGQAASGWWRCLNHDNFGG
jgi:hypothetical protein